MKPATALLFPSQLLDQIALLCFTECQSDLTTITRLYDNKSLLNSGISLVFRAPFIFYPGWLSSSLNYFCLEKLTGWSLVFDSGDLINHLLEPKYLDSPKWGSTEARNFPHLRAIWPSSFFLLLYPLEVRVILSLPLQFCWSQRD